MFPIKAKRTEQVRQLYQPLFSILYCCSFLHHWLPLSSINKRALLRQKRSLYDTDCSSALLLMLNCTTSRKAAKPHVSVACCISNRQKTVKWCPLPKVRIKLEHVFPIFYPCCSFVYIFVCLYFPALRKEN